MIGKKNHLCKERTGHAFHLPAPDDTKFQFQHLQVWLPLGQDAELRYAVFNIIYSFKK